MCITLITIIVTITISVDTITIIITLTTTTDLVTITTTIVVVIIVIANIFLFWEGRICIARATKSSFKATWMSTITVKLKLTGQPCISKATAAR